MKKYILFLFFAFQVSIYAQQSIISDSNFEKNLISLEIDTTSPDSKTQLINSSCDANSLTNLALNPAEIKSNQLKSLDVSKRIKMDYSIFIYNQLSITDNDNEKINLSRYFLNTILI